MKLLTSCSLLTTLCMNVYATPNKAPAEMEIYFGNATQAKHYIYQSYEKLFEFNHMTKLLLSDTSEALDASKNTDERASSNAEFQANKSKIDALFNDTTISFHTFNHGNNLIAIKLSDDTYKIITLDELNLSTLGLESIDIKTVSHAQAAVKTINDAMGILDNLLPLDASLSNITTLSGAPKLGPETHSTGMLEIYNADDKGAVIDSLVTSHDSLKHYLTIMNDNAINAANSARSSSERDTLNDAFQQYKEELSRSIDIATFGNIKTFNQNKITLNSTENTSSKITQYEFPTLNLSTFKINGDDVSTMKHAYIALRHIHAAEDWIENWIIRD